MNFHASTFALALTSIGLLAGCSSGLSGGAPGDGSGGDGSGGEAAGQGGSGGAGDAGGEPGDGGEGPQGLFDCGFATVCELSAHMVGYEPGDCLAFHVLSGEPGVVEAVYMPGGEPKRVSEDLYVYLGDGSAIVQSRTREGTLPWSPATSAMGCTTVIPPGLAEACEPGPDGEIDAVACWTQPGSTVADCVEVPIPSCEAIAAQLEP